MEAHVNRFSGAPGLPQLVDAMDLVISHLGTSKKATPTSTSWRPPSECFPSLKAAMLGDVACMELFLSSQPQSSALRVRVRVHSKQLKVLATLCHILTEMLVSSEEEIECSRDGPQQKQQQPLCSQSDDSLRSLLVDACLPILHQSCDIIDKVCTFGHILLGFEKKFVLMGVVALTLRELKPCPETNTSGWATMHSSWPAAWSRRDCTGRRAPWWSSPASSWQPGVRPTPRMHCACHKR